VVVAGLAEPGNRWSGLLCDLWSKDWRLTTECTDYTEWKTAGAERVNWCGVIP
jgi:hypothetical protein